MKRRVITFAAVGATVLALALWKGRAQQSAVPDFSGDWRVVSATGTTPPEEFSMQVTQSSTSLHVTAHWTEPANGQYGLTLLGLTTPEVTLSTDGREDLNQAGPFVFHARTLWSGALLVTNWTTSEFSGASFQGEWVRSLSADGHEMTIEIRTNSSKGQHSDAVLKFQKRKS